MTATASAPTSAACAASSTVSAVDWAPPWTMSMPRTAARKTTAARLRSSDDSRIPSPVVPQTKAPSPPCSSPKRIRGQMAPPPPALSPIRPAPKVLPREHLDGGLRPATLIELAAEIGYAGLPTTDPGELASWFKPPPGDGGRSLVRYLEAFTHTVAVMQTADAIERIAAESVEDLAADGIVYAEVRFAPEQHLREGLTLDEVVDAAVVGVQRGSAGRPIVVGLLLSGMRQAARSVEIAELAVRHRDAGVAGVAL